MDTDALLLSAQNAETSHEGLMKVIEANTAAWKEVRGDLAKCNNQDKVNAVIVKVEKAFTDLSIESQKIPQWMKDVRHGPPVQAPTSPPYGQYPINQPIHPYNPVPWPPGYTPPS